MIKKIVKFIFAFVFKTLGTVVLLLFFFLLILQTPVIKRNLAHRAFDQIERQTSIILEFDEVSGFLPLYLSVHNLKVKNNDSVFGSVTDLKITLSPTASWKDLFKGILSIELQVNEITSPILESFRGINTNATIHVDLKKERLLSSFAFFAVEDPKNCLHLTLKGSKDKLTGKIDLACKHEMLNSIHGTATFTSDNEKLTFPDIYLSSSRGKVAGYLDLSYASLLFEGKLEGILNEAGSFTTIFDHLQENRQQNIALSLSLPKHDHLVFQGNYSLQKPLIPFFFRIFDKDEEKLSITSSGILDLEKSDKTISLKQWEGVFSNKHFKLKDTASIRLHGDTFELSPLQLDFDEGSLFAQISLSNKSLSASLTTSELPLNLITILKPELPLDGSGNAKIEFTGTVDHPQGNFKVDLKNVAVKEAALAHLPLLQASIEGILKEKSVFVSTFVSGINSTPINITTELPLEFHFNPEKVKWRADEDITAHINADLDLAPLCHLFLTDTVRIGGNLKVGMDVSGTLENPKISGLATLSNGTYEDLDLGFFFQQLSATLKGDGSQLLISDLSGKELKSGTIFGFGGIDLASVKGFPFKMEIVLEKAALLQLDTAEAIGSGRLVFSGNKDKGLLKGDLEIVSAHISIPEETPKSLSMPLEITYINQPKGNKAVTLEKLKKEVWPVELALNMQIPKRAYAAGRNLNSEWKGEINITGLSDAPLLNGSLKIVSAQYILEDKIFKSHEGTITFNGDPAKKTSIYVVSELVLPKVKINAIVKGPLKDPEIAFTSSPAMSQKEIMSWILFNQSISEISPLQAVQLSQTLLSMGGYSHVDVVGNIRRKFGIDRLDIRNTEKDGTNEMTLRIGKYISHGFLVSINKNIDAETNQVAIEADLMKNVKVEAEIGDDSEGKMLLKWEKDY